MNRNFRRYGVIGATALLVAGCNGACDKIEPINAPDVTSGNADFSVYAAIGTSISAGSQSGGGLVFTHQLRAFPVLFSQQVGAARFTIPSISADGYRPLLRIISYSPLRISNAGRRYGVPLNGSQPTAYHNMGVPGAIIVDVGSSAFYARDSIEKNLFDYVVRGRGTILSEVASLRPTFVSFEIGSNEVLGPAVSGNDRLVFTPAEFAGLLHQTLDGLAQAAPNAKLAIFNVPDVTTIPFCTTFSWVALDTSGLPSPLIGPDSSSRRLGPSDRVLLTAADSLALGTGFAPGTRSYLTGAMGNGRPLPGSMVLSATEVANLKLAVVAYNQAIHSEAAARGAALADLNGLLEQLATTGIDFRGVHYDSEFLVGGVFSLDGVHPNDFGHGLLCNALIRAVNATFGSTIPLVDLGAVGSHSASVVRRVGLRRPMPWIQNAEAVYREVIPRRSVARPYAAR
jgi:hypothetical protein